MDAKREGWRALYPYDSHFLPVRLSKEQQQVWGAETVRQHYLDEGSGAGPTVVCVHGNPTWSFYYRSIVESFRGERRVVAVDHVGCGLSDKPSSYPYTLAQHTDNLVALIDGLDLQQIVMVVHDWGGAIGLGAALKRLDRMAGLVVLNTGAFPPPYIPLRIAACRIPLLGSFAMKQLNAFARAATVMAIDRLPRLDTAVRDGLLAPYDTAAHRVAIDGFVRDIPMKPTHPTYDVLKRLEGDWPRLEHLPTSLVWGMKDWCFTPECLRRFKAVWPRAQVHELGDVGHYVMEEAAREVCDAVRGVIGRV